MARARAGAAAVEEIGLLMDEREPLAQAVCEPLASGEMVAMSADRVTVEAKRGCRNDKPPPAW